MRIIAEALTFDDVLLVPEHSLILPREVSLQTHLTAAISLNIPLMSAAMDTVTEAGLAIALAQEGGMGIIHKNMSIEEQAQHVRLVKKFESGIVTDPITIGPDASIRDLFSLVEKHRISGVPVVLNDKVIGIVTRRDWRFENNLDQPVKNIMTPKERLITVSEGASQDEMKELLKQHRLEKLIIVADDFSLKGIITVKDFDKAKDKPLASKDKAGKLLVGAAVGTSDDTMDRVAALVEAGVDVVVVDTAHGHSQGVLNQVKSIKKKYSKLQVIGGNIATGHAAKDLCEAGADAVKVGIGPGSICTTRIVTGVGVPQITAISEVAGALKDTPVKVIADGGIRYSGDVAKALAAGAHIVMMGGMFAGTDEAPGEIILYQGRSYKAYRGMGSLGAMAGQDGSSDRYFQDKESGVEKLVPEGIEGRVPYKGSLIHIVHQLMGGLRSAMGYTGCADIHTLRTKPKFLKVTNASMKESHVHDVTITKEAPNYRSEY